jgi:acyl carrier protein
MLEADIYDNLTDIFRDLFADDTIVLTPGTTADDIEDWDSFNHVNLIVAVEVRFGITFETSEIEKLTKVGDLVAAIARKLSPRTLA